MVWGTVLALQITEIEVARQVAVNALDPVIELQTLRALAMLGHIVIQSIAVTLHALVGLFIKIHQVTTLRT